ncbi:hypothetical protein PC9H_003827 [Pleurotus ostreatus]|uniref:Uncharacterized protein n=1 Tax=Pleurotus ostreatus TaxID=5322 RepID=A0A8H6ZZ46_PLEOS|nr:uncharacterized protein PC9H_003827 [Pleurotus ostreatus]KAF7436993.1 hypothetical protein PC9H_003827 [Pleurotus ostreatus]KAJ8702829.1 hypothetical protein PTI98_001506 [Pleurotus ostreatus]
MNGDRPTEVTALLDRVRSPDLPLVPSIAPTLAHVSTLDVQHITADDLCPHDLADAPPEVRVAYTLIVLLRLRQLRLHKRPRTNNLWELWKELEENANDVELLDAHIASAWSLFVSEYHNAVEVEDALWIAFPEDHSKDSRRLRVVDFLYGEDSPRALVTHRLVQLSLLRRWKQGAFPEDTFASISPRIILDRYDNLGTPRIYHILDNVCGAIQLFLLASYLLYPPIVSIVDAPHVSSDYGLREIFIVILSLSLAIRSWSMVAIPPLLAFCAFMLSLPAVPIPGSTAFFILLLAFALQILALHLPIPTSPLLFLDPENPLPLASLFSLAIAKTAAPAFRFFLPVFTICFVLLSYSLADTFSLKIMSNLEFPIPTFSVIPIPIETRSAFLFILAIIFISFLSSLAILMNVLPKNCASPTLERWDRYTKPVGLEARRAFIYAVVYHSSPYMFPPPFNLLHLVFVRLPKTVARMIHIDDRYIEDWNKYLWRVIVGPLVAAMTVVVWTLRQTE